MVTAKVIHGSESRFREVERNFALVRSQEYKKYLEKNNKEDNDESKAEFLQEVRDAGKDSEERKKFARDIECAQPSDDERDRERVRMYADLNKEEYQNFLKEKGVSDGASARDVFYMTETIKGRNDPEFKKKWKSQLEGINKTLDERGIK